MDENRLKHTTVEQRKELETLLEALNEIKPKITCTGLLNAGKSTLLNALIGDFENETFATADIRETTDSKMITHDKLSYIDTPGLDATDSDTEVVLEVLKASDIVLFVHNINTGEFDPEEFKFLQTILKHWNDPKIFIAQTIFVLSRTDEIDTENEEEVINRTAKKIKSQIFDLFGCESTVVNVSAQSYQDAMKENEPLLLKDSNFSSLREKIEILGQEHIAYIYKNKAQRVDDKFKEIKAFLVKERKKLIDEKKHLQKKQKELKLAVYQELNKLNDVLRNKEKNYRRR